MFYLQTKRLGIRNFVDADCAFLHEIRNDARLARYQRWEDTSLSHICDLVDEHKGDVFPSEKEIQRYAVALVDGKIIGTLALFYTPNDNSITLGITIATAYQRQGYAKEILKALIDQMRVAHPGLDIVALIHPENAKSIRLFESLGFHLDLYAESIESLVYVLPPK